MRRSVLATACVMLASCASSKGGVDVTAASIDVTTAGFELVDESVLVQTGHGWPSASQELAAARPGGVAIRADRPAVAFIDVDGNGRLDPFRDPSGRCETRGERRVCSIDRERLSVHRVVNGRLSLAGEPYQVVGDQALVVFEAFDAHGNLSTDATACLEGAPDVCARFGGHPFVSSKISARAIPLCDLDLVTSASPVAVRIHGATSDRVALVVAPSRLGVNVTWKRHGSILELTARSEATLGQALAWIGGAEESLWSTEAATNALRWSAHEATIAIPLDVMESCSTCTVMVQLGAFVNDGDESHYVEERISVVRGT